VAAVASVLGIDAHIIEYIVEPTDRITRKPLKDIDFPRQAVIGAVMRGSEYVVPRGDTHIRSGDRVIVFTLPGSLSAVEKLFK